MNDDTPESFGASAAGQSSPAPPRSQAGEVDQRYRRETMIAAGGMGEVHLAWDRKLARHVAIKVARGGGEAASRLIAEAQHTASLDHPMIVAVHDTGVTADGRPFYAMRLIRGRALSAALRGADRGVRLRLLKHVLDACHAVAYAHSLGVLHRDLKPANVMIGEFGETQVVDWGLGTRRVAGQPSPDGTSATIAGSVLGTPAYMSPEQARGERVGASSDVWGLGAILHEVITGRPPHVDDDASAVIAHARGGDVASVATLAPDMPRELCAIADRALQYDPARRYADAGKLAEDIAAYMAGGRVGAHVYSPWELLTRVIRAWKGPLVVAGLALVVVITVVTLGGLRLAASRARAVAAEAETRAALVTSDTNYRRALVAQAMHAASEDRWAEAEVAVEALRGVESPEARGVLMAADALARASLVERIPLPECRFPEFTADGVLCGGTSLSRWADGVLVWRVPMPAAHLQVAGPRFVVGNTDSWKFVVGDVETGQFTTLTQPASDRFRLTATGWLTNIHNAFPHEHWAVDLTTGRQFHFPSSCPTAPNTEITAVHADPPLRLSYCTDGTMTLAGIDGTDPRAWSTTLTESTTGGALALAIDPRGERAAMGMVRGAVVLVDLRTGEATAVDSSHGAASEVAWAPDGASFAVRRDRGTVEIWDPRGPVIVGHLPALHARRIVHGDGVVRVLDAEAETRWTLTSPAAPAILKDPLGVGTAAFSPDGRALATGHGGAHTVVWDLADGSKRFAFESTGAAVKAVAWAPDGATLYTKTSGELGVRRHDARTGAPLPTFGPADALRRMVTMQGGWLLAIGIASTNSLWSLDPTTETSTDISGCEAIEWLDADISPDARSAVLIGLHGEVGRVLGDACTPVVRGLSAFRGAIADDGETLVIADEFAVSRVIGEQVVWRSPAAGVRDVAVSSDGQFAAVGSLDHTARIFDMRDGRVLAVLTGHAERVVWVGFSPDSSLLATGSWDGTVRMWPLRRLLMHVDELAEEVRDPGYPTIDALLR